MSKKAAELRRDKLAGDLAELPEWHERCAEVLDDRQYHFGERTSGRARGGIRLNEAAVAIRSDIVEVLTSWCRLIVEELHVPGPRKRDVWTLTEFLTAHIDWLSAHPDAGDFTAKLAELRASACEVVGRIRRTNAELGQCAWPACGRPLQLVRSTADDPAPCQVSCAAGHVWRPEQWLLLARGGSGERVA